MRHRPSVSALAFAALVLLGAACDVALFADQSVRIVDHASVPLAVQVDSSRGRVRDRFLLKPGQSVVLPLGVGKAIVNARIQADADTRAIQKYRDEMAASIEQIVKTYGLRREALLLAPEGAAMLNGFALLNAYLVDLARRTTASCTFEVKSDQSVSATFTQSGDRLIATCR